MVEEKGNEKQVKHNRDIIKLLCEVGVSDSKKALSHFLKLLDLDENLLNHLFNTKVVIDYSNDYDINELVSCYEVDENTIYILADYIDDVITKIDSGKREPFYSNLYKIPISLLHEFLYVNRDLLVSSNYNLRDSKLDLLHTNKISEGNKDKLMLLSITKRDNYLEAYVYNDYKKAYEIYLFDSKQYENLSYKVLFKKIDSTIKYNYYKNKIFNNSKVKPDDIIPIEYKSYIYNNSNNEEAFIECLSRIIISSRFNHTLNIKKTCEAELENTKLPDDLRECFNIIKDMSNEDIINYLFMSYQDNFDEEITQKLTKKFIER